MDDVVKEFVVESRENLDQFDLDLVALEREPARKDVLASVFRTIHTLKGTCGFFGFEKLERLTHAGETLLGRLRDGDLALNAEMTSALLAFGDAVRSILGTVESAGTDGDSDYGDLVGTLERLQRSGASAASTAPQPAPAAAPAPAPAPAPVAPPIPAPAAAAADPEPLAVPRENAHPQAEHDARATVADASVRVDVSLLDSLMNQVGELVLARNEILQYSESHHDPALVSTTQRLDLITTELQERVLKTRMQQIGTIWNKLPRLVRDLSGQLGKDVAIEMEGEETELDRTIIEAIKDPLTHIVRNSVDHGLELPEVRIAAGKPAQGTVRVRAFHEGGQVNIEIADDGAGIDRDAVKKKAVERGIVTPDQAARMSEREATHLIFLPGFSTAKKVTNISGRGVGMDVVKTNIEKIGGSVDVQSEKGRGTTLRIKIPLTLAIIPALIVTCGGDKYAIPQVCLLELVRLEGDQATKAVEMILDVPVHRLRGELLPMIWLTEQLRIGSRKDQAGGALHIAVLQAEDLTFGLVVDEICDNQEIVVKPLSKLLEDVTCYAGATIMGDGRVALILDAMGIAARAGIVSKSRERRKVATNDPDASLRSQDEQTLLLFTAGDDTPKAVPLSCVARLEEFPRSAIEHAAGRAVVQYRDDIMPLVRLSELLGTDAEDTGDGPLQVIAHQRNGAFVGVVVDRILDIVQEPVQPKRVGAKPPVLGTVVVHERVTEAIDIGAVITMAGLDGEAVTCQGGRDGD
ncbi:MAG: chemotaxis protein CheA [Planctomycetes bacterium]|nr:chemotaxis protein CheA [Planctomycetota bacterium]